MSDFVAYVILVLYSGVASYVYVKDEWGWLRPWWVRYLVGMCWLLLTLNWASRLPWGTFSNHGEAYLGVLITTGMAWVSALCILPFFVLTAAEYFVGFMDFMTSHNLLRSTLTFDRVDAAVKRGKIPAALALLNAMKSDEKKAGDPEGPAY